MMPRILSRLADSYRRWRHSRGFGVHSPFAYAMVKDALYPPLSYAYYLENDARLASADPAEARRARAFYRLVIFLRREHTEPLRIYVWEGAPECWRAALRLGGARLANAPDAGICRILPPVAEEVEIAERTAAEPTPTGCLVMASRHYTLIVPGRQMADTKYTLP